MWQGQRMAAAPFGLWRRRRRSKKWGNVKSRKMPLCCFFET
jgi:hypothetical protein